MSSNKRNRDAFKTPQSERERGGPHLVGFTGTGLPRVT